MFLTILSARCTSISVPECILLLTTPQVQNLIFYTDTTAIVVAMAVFVNRKTAANHDCRFTINVLSGGLPLEF